VAEVDGLAAYRALLARYRLTAAGLLVAAWDQLDTVDEDQVEEFEARTSILLEGVKVATVGAATAFVSRQLAVRPPSIAARSVAVAPDLRAPFTATWHALAEGRPFDEAIISGRGQADAVAQTFVTSTARRTGDAVATATGRTVRWRRVAEPGACAWCQRLDGSTYRSAAKADFGHKRCSCDVVPDAA
jgi:hypothetical protein